MQQKRKVLTQLKVHAVPFVLHACLPTAATTPVTDSNVRKLIAKARQATDKFHEVTVALTDGYYSTVVCIEVPELGGMRIHYVNFALAEDLEVDELTPEILLYIDTDEGPKLVGVEYFMIALANTTEGPAPWFG